MQKFKWITIICCALFLVVVASVVKTQHLYYMAAMLLTLPAMSYGVGWFTLRGITIQREVPSTVWQGETRTFFYDVRNPTRFTRFFLTLHEQVDHLIISEKKYPPLFTAEAKKTIRVEVTYSFRKRGLYHLDTFRVSASDPLGIFTFSHTFRNPAEIIVYPSMQPVNIVTLAGSAWQGWMDFSAPLLGGTSVDASGVRPYVPGDSLRRVHWRQTARTGVLNVLEFEEEQSINLMLILDVQQGSEYGKGEDTTLEYAIRLAASLANEAIQKGACVGLYLPEDNNDVEAEPPGNLGRGSVHLFRILEALARAQANSPISFSKRIEMLAEVTRPSSTLILITAQAQDALVDSITSLARTGAQVSVVCIDAASFPESRVSDRSKANLFAANVSQENVQSFLIRWNERGDVMPQRIF